MILVTHVWLLHKNCLILLISARLELLCGIVIVLRYIRLCCWRRKDVCDDSEIGILSPPPRKETSNENLSSAQKLAKNMCIVSDYIIVVV